MLTVLCVLIGAFSIARAASPREMTRGELLYSTHCIDCHATQVHWRQNSVVTDWQSLQSQVGRWQNAAGLGWSEEDIAEVTRYLNARHYDYPAPQ